MKRALKKHSCTAIENRSYVIISLSQIQDVSTIMATMGFAFMHAPF